MNARTEAQHLSPVRKLDHWDMRYVDLAKHVSYWSKDPSTQVGAVITAKNSVIALGFNGLPRGVEDSPERLNNREIKYKMIVHGEVNAMAFAERSLHGCTLYTYPFMPCPVCAGQVIQRGFKEVVAPYNENPRWKNQFVLTQQMFKEAGVSLILV